MDEIKEKLRKKEYQNWVKSTLGLDQTNKALQDYVEQKFTAYTAGTARLYNRQVAITASEIEHDGSYIRGNLKDAAKYDGHRWVWDSSKYPCKKCEDIFVKILSLHRRGKGFKDIHWENSGNAMGISLDWTIAKVFMPQGNEGNKGPKDTDPFAMFHLMLMCDLFFNCVKTHYLKGLKKARNTLFHSSENLVSDNEMNEYFDAMIGLLTDASNDTESRQDTRDNIAKDIMQIKNLKRSDLTMTVSEVTQEALRIQHSWIQYDFEKTLCENNPGQLREILKIAEEISKDIQLLKYVPMGDHIKQLRIHAKNLSADLNELKKRVQNLQSFSSDLDSVKAEMGHWQRALRKELALMESGEVIAVFIITIVMSLLLRVLLFLG